MAGNSGEPAEGAPDPLDVVDLKIDPIWCPISKASVHIDTALIRPGRIIEIHGPVEESVVSREAFDKLLEMIYDEGASPDIAYVSYDHAYERGIIGYWTWRWLKLRSALRSAGTWMRSALSGGRSAPPTRGT